MITLEEIKQYLRVDSKDEDFIIQTMFECAKKMCMDVIKTTEEEILYQNTNAKIAVLYAVAYLYEHREEADHRSLIVTLRALLFCEGQEVF